MNLALVLLFAASVGSWQGQSGKPVLDSPVMNHYEAPETLEAFTQRADAVVIATITSARDRSRSKVARTEYQMEISSVLKPHQNLGANSTVCRPIGSIEYSDRIVRRFEPNFPAFKVSVQYVLFLHWNEREGCYFTPFGPSGVGEFRDDGGLRPLTRHHVLSQLAGMHAATVNARISAVTQR